MVFHLTHNYGVSGIEAASVTKHKISLLTVCRPPGECLHLWAVGSRLLALHPASGQAPTYSHLRLIYFLWVILP